MSFDFDSLTDKQKETLRTAGCVVYTGRHEFTTNWQAWQARVALAVMTSWIDLVDKNGNHWCDTNDSLDFITDDYAPYNIVVDEPKPEWTVDSLMAAIRDGRYLIAKKPGFVSSDLRCNDGLFLSDEMRARYLLDPANGWTIEEIV